MFVCTLLWWDCISGSWRRWACLELCLQHTLHGGSTLVFVEGWEGTTTRLLYDSTWDRFILPSLHSRLCWQYSINTSRHCTTFCSLCVVHVYTVCVHRTVWRRSLWPLLEQMRKGRRRWRRYVYRQGWGLCVHVLWMFMYTCHNGKWGCYFHCTG